MDGARYVRFQGTTPNGRGLFAGVFALVNGLAKDGVLTADQERFRRANNEWYNANFPNPAEKDSTVYDRELHPGAVAWFKVSADEFIERVDGYLQILAAHGVDCATVQSADPGKVIYEDQFQVVVVPHQRTR